MGRAQSVMVRTRTRLAGVPGAGEGRLCEQVEGEVLPCWAVRQQRKDEQAEEGAGLDQVSSVAAVLCARGDSAGPRCFGEVWQEQDGRVCSATRNEPGKRCEEGSREGRG